MTRKKKSAQAPPESLSGGKRVLFFSILLAIPIVVVILLEVSLRVFSYGGDAELITEKVIGGRPMYVVNRAAGRLYFQQSGTIIPELSEDAFTIVKSPHTRRIFCLGESTMEGFPYEFNATAPSFLRDRLHAAFPRDTVEVVNIGLSAVGSFVLVDFLRSLVRYQPDLIIVYSGHNEFYGAYGPASTVDIPGGAWMKRLSIRLLHFKSYQLLRDTYGWIIGSSRGKAPLQDATLMQQMVGNQEIPFDSDLYRRGRDVFRENITTMIDIAKDRHIPIMFSALVSNLRDQPPFASRAPLGTSWPDSVSANTWFSYAKTLLDVGRVPDALAAYRKAKDLDLLRFRATEEFQSILVDECRIPGVYLSHVDSSFSVASPLGIVGHELMLEHLHPDIAGYFLMAKTWTQDIRDAGIIGTPDSWSAMPSDSTLLRLSTVSKFDEKVGEIRVILLRKHWPFVRVTDQSPFVPRDSLEEIVYRYVRHHIGWSDGRYAAAEYYAGHRDFSSARNECEAVGRVIPYSYQPILRIGDYYTEESDLAGAEKAYRRCLAIADNPFAHMKLGFVYLTGGRAGDAVHEIETGFVVNNQQRNPMKPSDNAFGRYLLGVGYAQLGRNAEARQALHNALAIDPSMIEAEEVLKQIEKSK